MEMLPKRLKDTTVNPVAEAIRRHILVNENMSHAASLNKVLEESLRTSRPIAVFQNRSVCQHQPL